VFEQLRLNSFGTVSEIERRRWGSGHKIAERPLSSFSFIKALTSSLLAAIRICSISSELRCCLEQLRCDNRDMYEFCEAREHRESQLRSMRERTDEHGMLIAMSELIEPQLSKSSRGDRRALGVQKAERAGDADAFLECDLDDA
jgi:hypothetical protein